MSIWSLFTVSERGYSGVWYSRSQGDFMWVCTACLSLVPVSHIYIYIYRVNVLHFHWLVFSSQTTAAQMLLTHFPKTWLLSRGCVFMFYANQNVSTWVKAIDLNWTLYTNYLSALVNYSTAHQRTQHTICPAFGLLESGCLISQRAVFHGRRRTRRIIMSTERKITSGQSRSLDLCSYSAIFASVNRDKPSPQLRALESEPICRKEVSAREHVNVQSKHFLAAHILLSLRSH